MTEEELLEHVTQYAELHKEYLRGNFTDLPSCYQTDMKPYFEMENLQVQRSPLAHPDTQFIPDLIPGEYQWAEEDEFTMVPMYNTDGGVSAEIHSWAAMNATCKRPEEAFFVLDYLFGKYYEVGDPTPFGFGSMRGWLARFGVPVYRDMMKKESPVESIYVPWYGWKMNDANFEEFVRVRDQINCVGFYDTLDAELDDLHMEIVGIVSFYRNGIVEDVVHEYYTRMKRELSE